MFSNSTKYAIRAIVHMLQHQDKGKNTVVEMATELSIPQPYLSKVLQQLISRSSILIMKVKVIILLAVKTQITPLELQMILFKL